MIFFGHLGLTTGAIKVVEKLDCNIKVDYRFVLIGLILPDIIDKPIGAFLFRNIFHNSRIFGHTLLFPIIIMLFGVYSIKNNKKSNVLFLGIASFIHLVLDSMWLYPQILFWPILGFKFPTRPEGSWIKNDFVRLVSDSNYYMPELIGFVIIAYYFIKIIKNKNVKAFLKEGKL
ncbi:metal-dependent hydrolase [Clostridium sp. JN-1]|jgi:membrane-bound metal-dependent hydrolase YbcI (DUF457 family)|uniref:metal-dependent hydrolase n=1 Tax=Clostridium sp. JN-1 TaxID=2483110 RepID=UPI000F0B8F13|nr:metal-dependent hydrolase [Clostridium sp. JN-1]